MRTDPCGCIDSMPAMVIAACSNTLKPSIDATRSYRLTMANVRAMWWKNPGAVRHSARLTRNSRPTDCHCAISSSSAVPVSGCRSSQCLSTYS